MPAGRPPSKPVESKDPNFNEVAIRSDFAAADQLAAANAAFGQGVAAGDAVGQMRTWLFLRSVAETGALAAFENVKKSRAWERIADCDGRNFSNLDDFCQAVFGKSYRRLQEQVGNRNLLGQEVFEQAEQLGLRQVDYNTIKALPAPEQELVRRAVQEASTKDEVVGLIEELATRSAKRDEGHAKDLDEERREHAATKKRLEATVKMRDRAEAEAARIATLPPNEKLAELKIEATKQAAFVLAGVQGHLRQALIALSHEEQDQTIFMAGLVGQVVRELSALRAEFVLPDLSNAVEAQAAADAEQWFKPKSKGG